MEANSHGRTAAAAAVAGTAAYWLALRPDWRNPALLLYDVPTLVFCFGFAGRMLGRLVAHPSPRSAAPFVGMAPAAILAAGALAGLPLSGHATTATTAAILEQTERDDPPVVRAAAAVPAVTVTLIRAFWPQSALMHSPRNTVIGLAAGVLLGATGAYCVVRSARREAGRAAAEIDRPCR